MIFLNLLRIKALRVSFNSLEMANTLCYSELKSGT